MSQMWPPEQSRRLLAVVHLCSVAFSAASAGFGLAYPAPSPASPDVWVAPTLVLAAGALQLRHTLAAAIGSRPRYWQASLLAVLAIAYVPVGVYGQRWFSVQWFAIASIAMLAPGPRALFVIVSATATALWFAKAGLALGAPDSLASLSWTASYGLVIELLASGALFASAWLVRLTEQLREARESLADLTVGRERMRIARDVHDLLGQSLSAISLKGDVALRQLEHGETALAVAEVDDVIALARSALHDLRTVAHGAPPVTFALEAERAVDLISSAGVETQVQATQLTLSPSVDALFAWAVREGVTNVLRHSTATSCAITCEAHQSRVRLEIVNDGALPQLDVFDGEPPASGTGLGGLHARAAALGGFAHGQRLRNGRFRLIVEVPADGMPSAHHAAPVHLTVGGEQ